MRAATATRTAKGRAAPVQAHRRQVADGLSYERTHNVPISRPVLNKIREKQIAYRAAVAAA